MNIKDCIGTIQVVPRSEEAWANLLVMRRETFCGFASIEAKKGFMKPAVSFSTSKGQEMLRIIMFRLIEELVESEQSHDPDHIKEEAIDAINYLLSGVMLDTDFFDVPELATLLSALSQKAWDPPGRTDHPLSVVDIGDMVILIAGRVGDSLRSRAWMNQDQHPYFEGKQALTSMIDVVAWRLFKVFSDWDEFYRFFVAKDLVLQFRLATSY